MSLAPIRLAMLLSLVLLLAGSTVIAAPGDVGTPAADFSLQVYGGGTQTLSEHSGKVVMLFIMGYA